VNAEEGTTELPAARVPDPLVVLALGFRPDSTLCGGATGEWVVVGKESPPGMINPDTVSITSRASREWVVFGKESPSGMRNPEIDATARAIL
jgi:hypothetical protein